MKFLPPRITLFMISIFCMVYLPRMMEEPLFGVCCLFSLGWTINSILQSRFYSLYGMSYYQSLCVKFECGGRPIPILGQLFVRWAIHPFDGRSTPNCLFQINSHSCGAGYWFPPVMDDQLSFWCSSLVTSSWWTTPLLPRLFMLNDELSIWTIRSICFFLMDDQATSEVSPSLFQIPLFAKSRWVLSILCCA